MNFVYKFLIFVHVVWDINSFTMRTNVDIDDTLLKKAMKLSQSKTKKEAINEGLKALILIEQQKKILKLKGNVTWEGNLSEMRDAG